MKFSIHPVAYFILLCFEMYVTFKAVEVFTGMKFDKEKLLKGQVFSIITIFALDALLFKFTKTPIRSFIILGFLMVVFKHISNVSFIKAFIQILILFAVLIIVDFSVMLVAKLILRGSLMLLMDNFIIMYSVYVITFGTIVYAASKFNVKLMDLNKLRI